MDIHAFKLELLQKLLATKNVALLQKIGDLLQTEQADWWNELNEPEQEALQRGAESLDRGEKVDYEALMRNFRA